jgi:GNAT superfamily N-acetyltransferase
LVPIRLVSPHELTALREIECAAGEQFRDIGMPEVADYNPLPVEELARFQEAGRAWVAVDSADHPIGYLLAESVDGNLHIEQVSVHPANARRGVGRQLIEQLADHATADGVPALTLTTFVEVPWNAPYYVRCGFHLLNADDLTPGLVRIREHEAALGLDRWPRACMRRDLTAPAE